MFAFGLGLARPLDIAAALSESCISMLPSSSYQRSTIATDHFCIRSPPHPSSLSDRTATIQAIDSY